VTPAVAWGTLGSHALRVQCARLRGRRQCT
jgi:hypothetical protein